MNKLITSLIMVAALNADVPPDFVLAVAYAEHWGGSVESTVIDAKAVSRPNTNGSVDRGVMQLNSYVFKSLVAWDDPAVNIAAGVTHIKVLSAQCTTWWEVALAYNCGFGRMHSELGPPQSSLRYADRVIAIWHELSGAEYLPTAIQH